MRSPLDALRRMVRQFGAEPPPPPAFAEIVAAGRALLVRRDAGAATGGAIWWERQPATTGLRELMQALARPRQWEQLTAALRRARHTAPAAVEPRSLFFEEEFAPGQRESVFALARSAAVAPGDGVRLDLTRQVIFATPWDRERLVTAVGFIGPPGNPWQHDALNHSAELVEPFGFAFVTGGNHSIAAGIFRGELALDATHVTDWRPLLRQLRCDGRVVRWAADGRVVGRVRDPVFGTILELGRLYVEHEAGPGRP